MGTVFIHSFGGSPDGSGKFTEEKYEVRAGNHTVAARGTYEEAYAVAAAMCGLDDRVPQGQPPNVAEASAPETNPEKAAADAGVEDLNKLGMADLRVLMDGKGLEYNARARKAELIDHLSRAAALA